MNQNFCSVLLKKFINPQKSLFHNSGVHFGNHYETLKVQRNCTSKEIRDSFIKLSKQNHPDVNKDPSAHKEFLKIQEAYDVLSKSASRTSYNLGLARPDDSNKNDPTQVRSTRQERGQQMSNGQWDEPFFYNGARPGAQYEDTPYYGIRGVNKVSNELVAFMIIMLALAAFFGQMIAINQPNVRPWEKEYKEKSEGK